jgi:molecular chaperone GrpE
MKQDSSKPKVQKRAKQPSAQDYQQQIGELTEHLQRLQAEFENYKKRAELERSEVMNLAKLSVLTELLPALDNFDRAATHLPPELEDNAWAKGMSYVGSQLEQILDGIGVRKFSAKGEAFDHNRHEAMEYVEGAGPPDVVVEELTPGYEINGKVVRPATVKVSKAINQKVSEEQVKEEE